MSSTPKNFKWYVLGAFSLVAGLSQLLWLNFAAIIPTIQAKYGVTETQASLLMIVFPLLYVFLALPAGAYLDKYGYKAGIGHGAIAMSLFSILRIADQNFWVLLLCQIGISAAQPFIINGISKLVLDWFEKEETVIATGLGTMGMFIGMAIGISATPPMIDAIGFRGTMAFFGLMTSLSTLIFYVVVRKNPVVKNTPDNSFAGFKDLFKNKELLNIFAISFLGLGFFNGLTTWLELILAPHGITSPQAGIAGGVLILGGIVGAGIIPAISEFFKRRKPFLLGSILAATLTLYPLCNGRSYNSVLLYSAIQGFFFLPAYSLLMEMCSEVVGEARAASATGILMLTGNLGGVVIALSMEWVKGSSTDFTPAVNLLFIVLIVSLGLGLKLPEAKRV